jgi:hypothetical protein
VNVVTLHLHHSAPSDDFGVLRRAAPALDPEARVLLWDGLPPAVVPESPWIAGVVLQGDVDGHRVYAEQVPPGLPLDEVDLPAPLLPPVLAAAAAGLAVLHDHGQVHGMVRPSRIWLGADGSVVLVGRGRRGGEGALDRDALSALAARLGGAQARLDGTIAPEVVDGLGAVVEAALPARLAVLDQVHLQVGPSPDSLDEVVPDIGPDVEGRGLLDRWALTTHHGHTDEPGTGEATDAGTGASSPLALTLWTTLAAPARHPAPPDRFRAVDGEPSRGLRALLLEEPPDSLPTLLGGEVGAFLLSEETDPTGVALLPVDYALTDPEVTPALHDEDGDTAIYNVHEERLREALRKADTRSALAELEARVRAAEKRAREADERARSADQRARRAEEERRRAASQVDAISLEAGLLAGFLRVEVFVALVVGALVVWLLFRAFG